MIELRGVSTRRGPLALADVTLAWGPGLHAVVGAAADGGAPLLALVAGALRPRSGKLQVLGGAPTDPGVRRRIGYVPLGVSLPDGLRVDEVLVLAATLRADPVRAPSERLAVLGVEALARRAVRSLSRAEARAVALAEALTSPGVQAILVEEPLMGIDPRAASRVRDALSARGHEGCAVVVATGSLRDATALADDYVLMAKGCMAAQLPSFGALAGYASNGARLLVVAPTVVGAQALVGRLASEADVLGIEYGPPSRGAVGQAAVVRVHGRNVLVLAKAVARAAIETGVDILQLCVEPASLDDVRAGIEAKTAPNASEPTSRPAIATAHGPLAAPPHARGT